MFLFSQPLVVILSLFVGTWIISSEWTNPGFLIAGFFILYIALTFHGLFEMSASIADDDKPGRTISIMCGWIWVVWMTYGFLLKDVPSSDSISYIQGFVIVVAVLVSYFETATPRAIHFIFLILLFAFLISNQDGIYSLLPTPILYGKVVLFFFLYILTDINDTLSYDRNTVLPMRNSDIMCGMYPVLVASLDQLIRIEIKLMRSVWILFVHRYLLALSLGQIVFALMVIFKRFNKKPYIPPTIEQPAKTIKGKKKFTTTAPLPKTALPPKKSIKKSQIIRLTFDPNAFNK
jgi:hypothetical protein